MALVPSGVFTGTVAGTFHLISLLKEVSENRRENRPWEGRRRRPRHAWAPGLGSGFFVHLDTSLGSADLVLPKAWRMLAPVEALTGILMCGLSAALFFTIMNRIYASRSEAKPK